MGDASIPAQEDHVVDTIADALRSGERLAIAGGGSKDGIGRPTTSVRRLPMCGLTGIVDYDPAELVLTVRPGTPLAEVVALVAGERQMLAFEPFDHGPMLGRDAGRATIGGIVAAGVAGSRRLSAGGARDHLLGLRAVSGRGEVFVAGAKVVKNVTGYDLPKLATGSWGRLCALTEVTLKVLPAPETAATRAIVGLDAATAVRALAAAMGSQAEVACAACRPSRVGTDAIVAIRVEGFAPSVKARGDMLDRLLGSFGTVHALPPAEADDFWAAARTLDQLSRERALWRINVAPGAGSAVAQALATDSDWLMDWAGGLLWIATDTPATTIREIVGQQGGHATLVRRGTATVEDVPAFHPQATGVAALEERVRRAFDPQAIFETGRF